MTVIFAPTRTEKGNGNCDKKEKNNDEYYILKPDLRKSTNDDIIPLTTPPQIKMKDDWIEFYQQNKLDALEQASGHSINETKSIWFDKESIYSWRDGIQSDPSIVQVILGFASYDDGDLKIPGPYGGSPRRKIDNQISIVLSISSDFIDDKDTYFVPRKQLGKKSNSNNFLADFTGYYDTGKPCPPPTSGCS